MKLHELLLIVGTWGIFGFYIAPSIQRNVFPKSRPPQLTEKIMYVAIGATAMSAGFVSGKNAR